MTVSDCHHDRQFTATLRRREPDSTVKDQGQKVGEVHNVYGDMFLGTRYGERHSAAALVAEQCSVLSPVRPAVRGSRRLGAAAQEPRQEMLRLPQK